MPVDLGPFHKSVVMTFQPSRHHTVVTSSGTARLLVGMAAGRAWDAAAHWLSSGLTGVVEDALAGLGVPVMVVTVQRLELAAIRDGVCFMLVSCALGMKSAIYDCLVFKNVIIYSL